MRLERIDLLAWTRWPPRHRTDWAASLPAHSRRLEPAKRDPDSLDPVNLPVLPQNCPQCHVLEMPPLLHPLAQQAFLPEAILLEDTSRSRVSQHVVREKPIQAEALKRKAHHCADCFAHISLPPRFNSQPETELALGMLGIDVAKLNQAAKPRFALAFDGKYGGSPHSSFGLPPSNVPFGLSSRIGVRYRDHGIGDLPCAGSGLDCRCIHHAKPPQPKPLGLKYRLVNHQRWRGSGSDRTYPGG